MHLNYFLCNGLKYDIKYGEIVALILKYKSEDKKERRIFIMEENIKENLFAKEEKRKERTYRKENKKKNTSIIKDETKRKSKKKSTKDIDKKEECFTFKEEPLKIIPLGGILEIGKNITAFEYKNEIIIVDCGLGFPEDDMLGIDLVIPDFTYLEKNKEKIKGLFITHGHEDHIGGIPYLLKQINVPIYATKLTAALIENKLEEHKLTRTTKLKIIRAGQTVDAGAFRVEFLRITHSIPDACSLAIHTPVGTVVHTGDFKIDYTPIDGETIDFGRLATIGNKGVLALLSDSTNAERKGYAMSESTVGDVLDKLFVNCTKRIVVATFSSNVHRIQQIVNSAVENGRKVAICGRSMVNVVETARKLRYIQVPDNSFIDIDDIKSYPDEKLTIITTGSQGEPMSALTRMASGEHKKVEITPNDLIIISANPIPGNEKYISKVIDDLMAVGAEVIYNALQDIHVSGHACQEEQKLMLSLIRPKYFIPVHGEYRQLMAHAETARKVGVLPENIIIPSNGRVIEITNKEAKLTTTVPFGKVMVDGLGVGDVGNIVLRDRQKLSQDGLIIIVLTMSKNGKVVAGPDVITRGFVYVRESENLIEDIKKILRQELDKCEEKNITDWASIKLILRDSLHDYVYKKTKRLPMILPIIMEV